MNYTPTDNDMKRLLKEWNENTTDKNAKLKPDMIKWKKTFFGGWKWVGNGVPDAFGSWVTYSGEKTVQNGPAEYHTEERTVYIWEGPEPPKGIQRPPRPDLTPNAISARNAKQKEEEARDAEWRSPEAVAQRKRESNARNATRVAERKAADAEAAAAARNGRYNKCIAEFGPISGGTRKKRKNRDTKKKKSRRYK
jgi:hypothetical protein